MYAILISEHARQRARERGMPQPELLRAVRAAQQTGDGIYRSQHGQVVVERAIAKTVLAPNMQASNARLFEYSVKS